MAHQDVFEQQRVSGDITTARIWFAEMADVFAAPGGEAPSRHQAPSENLEVVAGESVSPYTGSVKTTIDIPEEVLRDAMRFTRATTKRDAVVTILEEFNRRRRMAELVKYAGTFSDQFPTNEEIEAVDAPREESLRARPRR